MNKIMNIFFYLLLINISVYAQNKESDVNHLALATLMIYDGKLDKAREELELVNKESQTFDASKYYTVKGVLASKMEDDKGAIFNFNKAIEATKIKVFKAPKVFKKEKYLFSLGSSKAKEDNTPKFDGKKVKQEKLDKLYIYLSQAYHKVKDYANTASSLDLAGEKGRDRASLFALRADCYWKIKEHSKAIEALNRGSKLFPNDTTLLKQKFYYFADLGLYISAVENAKLYMQKTGADAKEYITLAQLLISAKQTTEALKILEEAKAKFPMDAKIGILLGHTYLQKEMKFTTAHLFKESSYKDKKYLKDAVEMHRRVKDYSHAIYLNSMISDKAEKIKQKLSIYLDRAEYEKIIGLKHGLQRYNLLKDDNLRYALAYAYYMAKDYEAAEKHLKKISDNELFLKATVIRKNIAKCRDNSMECI